MRQELKKKFKRSSEDDNGDVEPASDDFDYVSFC